MEFLKVCIVAVFTIVSASGLTIPTSQAHIGAVFSNQKEKSFVISPSLVSATLGVLYFGSEGSTAAEMRKYLGLPKDDAKIGDLYKQFLADINSHKNGQICRFVWSVKNKVSATKCRGLTPTLLRFAYDADNFNIDADFNKTVDRVFGQVTDILNAPKINQVSPFVTASNAFYLSFDNVIDLSADDSIVFEKGFINASIEANLVLELWNVKADIFVLNLQNGTYKFVIIKPHSEKPADISNCMHFLNFDQTFSKTKRMEFKRFIQPSITINSNYSLDSAVRDKMEGRLSFSKGADFSRAGHYTRNSTSFYINLMQQSVDFVYNKHGVLGSFVTNILTDPAGKSEPAGSKQNDDSPVGAEFDKISVEPRAAAAEEAALEYLLKPPFVYGLVTVDNNIILAGKQSAK